ncbi:MAG: hypothetical protein EOM59_13590 [Clostridia bacterium]|nr:hypothetical protein [Clostridia bacterium]
MKTTTLLKQAENQCKNDTTRAIEGLTEEEIDNFATGDTTAQFEDMGRMVFVYPVIHHDGIITFQYQFQHSNGEASNVFNDRDSFLYKLKSSY